MEPYKLYFQRIDYDGESYSKGSLKETLSEWGIACSDSQDKPINEMKSLTTLSWPGEDGSDVYVPETPRAKEYEIQLSFVYCGEDEFRKQKIQSFIDFLKSGRLAYYDEFTEIGRKDVVYVSYAPDKLIRKSSDENDSISIFKMNFRVHDPTTDITPVIVNNNVTELTWIN